MRRTFALLAATAAWGAAASAPASAQCAFVVVRHDRAYFLHGGPRYPGIRAGAPLAGTVEPGCSDMAGVAPAPAHVRARRIPGVSPDVALLVRGRALVATGYLPQVAGFPLPGMGVDGTSGCRIGAPASLTGSAHFSLPGLACHGLPSIGDGQRVPIDAVHCGRRIVARRIGPAGPIVPETSAEDILGRD